MKVFDMHQDLSLYTLLEKTSVDLYKELDRHCDIPKYRRAGVKAFIGSVFPGRYLVNNDLNKYLSLKNAFEESLNHILVYYKIVRKHRVFKIVRNRKDLLFIFEKSKRTIGIVLGLEGCYPLREIDDLEIFYNLGIRVVGLTWNYDNIYASGCMSKRDYGLTDYGVKLIEKINEMGLVVDLAHASYKSIIDTLSITSKPVIISHTGLKKFNNSPRNISDEVLDMIKRNRGVVGVFFVPEYIAGENTTIDNVVDQIMYMYENYGLDIIGIGSDYFGTTKLPRGLENIGLINNLVEKLVERGLSMNDIEKIMYRNALRVFLENMK